MPWCVAQLGRREEYLLGRALLRLGDLRRLYTDIWTPPGSLLARARRRFGLKFGDRYSAELASSEVVDQGLSAYAWHIRQRRALGSLAGSHQHFARHGAWFASAVARDMLRRARRESAPSFWGYTDTSLEILRLCRDQGWRSVISQIDGAWAEEALVAIERRNFPGWETDAESVPELYWERIRGEWAEADTIVVNSEWTRSLMVGMGAPQGKLTVLPLAFEPLSVKVRQPRPSGQTLQVLWVGQVILRKGIQYLLEAARLLKDHDVRFTVVGPIYIADRILKGAPPNVKFFGYRPTPARFYEQADLYVLPTISDGFALTQLEAMADGLPVITTPNCGQVVDHGKDGLIVPARDANALAQAILLFQNDRERLADASLRASAKARTFGIDAFAQRLVAKGIVRGGVISG